MHIQDNCEIVLFIQQQDSNFVAASSITTKTYSNVDHLQELSKLRNAAKEGPQRRRHQCRWIAQYDVLQLVLREWKIPAARLDRGSNAVVRQGEDERNGYPWLPGGLLQQRCAAAGALEKVTPSV